MRTVMPTFKSTWWSRTPWPQTSIPHLPTWDGGAGRGTRGPRAGCTALAWSGFWASGSEGPRFASIRAFPAGGKASRSPTVMAAPSTGSPSRTRWESAAGSPGSALTEPCSLEKRSSLCPTTVASTRSRWCSGGRCALLNRTWPQAVIHDPRPVYHPAGKRGRDRRHPRTGCGRPERQQGLQRRPPAVQHKHLVPARHRQGAAAPDEGPSDQCGRRCGDQGTDPPQPREEPGGRLRAPARHDRRRGGGAAPAAPDEGDARFEGATGQWQDQARQGEGAARARRRVTSGSRVATSRVAPADDPDGLVETMKES